MAVKLRNPRKKVLAHPRFVEGYPRFRTCISEWPDMVEFRTASSEIRGRKKKAETLVKKSADNYMSGGLNSNGMNNVAQVNGVKLS